MLADRHLNGHIKTAPFLCVTIPPLGDTGQVWEGNEKAAKESEVAQMKSAKVILGFSKCIGNAVGEGQS